MLFDVDRESIDFLFLSTRESGVLRMTIMLDPPPHCATPNRNFESVCCRRFGRTFSWKMLCLSELCTSL